MHRELCPRGEMDITVWISFIRFLFTLLENSFHQSPSQIQTEDFSLKEQSKEVLSGTTVPAVLKDTDLPEG